VAECGAGQSKQSLAKAERRWFIMAQVKQYKAKKPLTLDCGHHVAAGGTFAVTKVFTCEADATRITLPKAERGPAPSSAQPPVQS
jgi:hypothetical protein